jgi:hypothetical protein
MGTAAGKLKLIRLKNREMIGYFHPTARGVTDPQNAGLTDLPVSKEGKTEKWLLLFDQNPYPQLRREKNAGSVPECGIDGFPHPDRRLVVRLQPDQEGGQERRYR